VDFFYIGLTGNLNTWTWTCIWLRIGILPCKFSFIYDNNFLQAMIIISWSNLGLVGVLTDEDVFKNVSSIFITYAILNFFQGTQFLHIFSFFCIYFCEKVV